MVDVINNLHGPASLFIAGGLMLWILPAMPRKLFMLIVPVVSLLLIYDLPTVSTAGAPSLHVLTYTLYPFRVDRLSLVFGYLFHIAAFIAVVFSLHINDRIQQSAGLIYAGGALGAVFAGDLLTLFVYWEIMAVSSVFLIWARRTGRAFIAGLRYLIFQVLSGVLLLAGTLVHVAETGSLVFDKMTLDTAGWLILLAFGIKAAFPMMHSWLTDAYPEATPTGTVFLASFTTKAAVYCLARGYAGESLLITIGAVMAAFPIFYAVIENDMRRVLAYSMINQVGFMVVGIGIGTALAINGAVAHAFNDVIFKGLLMMSMGAVMYRTGRIHASDLGGLYKTMPKTMILCLIGAASISAFPLFSGFVSKSMIVTAAIKEGYDFVWLILLFAAAGVFHHAGIKIPYFTFFGHDAQLKASEPPVNMLIAMMLAAILCIAIGSFPMLLYRYLPLPMVYSPYDLTHVYTQLQLLFFSAMAFVWLNQRGLYPPELHSTNLDSDWLYRRVLRGLWNTAYHWLCYWYQWLCATARRWLQTAWRNLVFQGGLYGYLGRTLSSSKMVALPMMILLLIVLYNLWLV